MSVGGESDRKLKIFLWIISILLGFFQIWLGRNSMNPDGISYLDMGDAYFRGDWKMAINAQWSPLYSWIIASGLHIFHPSIRLEFIIVHLMQFLIYVFTIYCFHFFLMEIIRWNQKQASPKILVLSNRVWFLIGYSLFIWSSLKLITLTNETPDMIAVALLYLSTAMTLRILNGGLSVLNFILLGIFLGLGYLARAPFFPLAFIFLIIIFVGIKNSGRALPLTLAALLSFLSLSGPFIYALSTSKGRFTVGESGKLNYAWKVNKVPQQYIHWRGTPGFGKPKHPTRKIFDAPPIYEFATPISGTYPPWYDPTYWYDGIEAHFNLKQEIARMVVSLRLCIDAFFHTEDNSATYSIFGADALTIASLVLFLISDRKRFLLKDLARQYPLLVPSFFGLAMYVLVWVQPRYIAGYLVLLWLGIFSSIRLAETSEKKNLSEAVAVAVSLVLIVGSSVPLIFDFYGDFRNSVSGKTDFVSADIAEGLQKIGIPPGSKVSDIGYSFEAYWARLARDKIVSEITNDDANEFWKANADVRNEVYKKFAETGASIVVTNHPPDWANLDGWNEIGHTKFFVHDLRKANNDPMHQ